MVDIIHRVGIKAPVSKVFAAVATIEGVQGWWTRETTGQSKVGGEIKFPFYTPKGDLLGGFVADVVELTEDQKVIWRFKDGDPEWIETEATFELKTEGEYTIVLFGHRKWKEATEGMAHCSMKWATFLLSLRAFAETGKGLPSPEDLKIDNWN